MAEALTFTFPVPPSTNHAFRNTRDRGGRALTKEGADYKRLVRVTAMLEARSRRWQYRGGRLSLSLVLHFTSSHRRDISNCIKLLEDGLSEGLGFDDCCVDVLHVERKENDKANPRCEVRLEVMG